MQVSPTYSKEVAGNPVIAPHLYKFHGIVNGIDPDIWDPYNDKFIPVSVYRFSWSLAFLLLQLFLVPFSIKVIKLRQLIKFPKSQCIQVQKCQSKVLLLHKFTPKNLLYG